jgi:hypothetical protein
MAFPALECRHCKQRFPHATGTDQFCSDRCREQYPAAWAAAVLELEQQGFIRQEEPPNVLSKDGVAVTVEEVLAHGIEDVVAAHGSALASPAQPARGQRPAD